MTRALAFSALLILASCGGLPRPTGNELGGSIQWFATNMDEVQKSAEQHCAKYGKRARIRDVRAEAGGHAFFDCL